MGKLLTEYENLEAKVIKELHRKIAQKGSEISISNQIGLAVTDNYRVNGHLIQFVTERIMWAGGHEYAYGTLPLDEFIQLVESL